jgi:hypothetical protein
MATLRARYADVPDHLAPKIILLDRQSKRAQERKHLERLIQSVSVAKSRDWLGRLLSPDGSHHLGAWLEITLCDWLQQIGPVRVEPEISGTWPDFGVLLGDREVYVEARVVLRDPTQADMERRSLEVEQALKGIKEPYIIGVHVFRLGGALDLDAVRAHVIDWLHEQPYAAQSYRDDSGNWLRFTPTRALHLETVSAHRIIGGWASSQPIISPLRKKAGQHRALRQAGHPYVIAILLDSLLLSAEEVAEAWFGTSESGASLPTRQAVAEGASQRGLQFYGREVKHTTVSGTLVFTPVWDEQVKRRALQAYYIQNPYASTRVRLDPRLFPAEAYYEIAAHSPSTLTMEWRRAAPMYPPEE